jgi:hypothetical protein
MFPQIRTKESFSHDALATIKGSPVHVAPACAWSGEGSDHFGSYVRSLSLHFCKRLFPGLERMTSWSQASSFTAVPRLPFTH